MSVAAALALAQLAFIGGQWSCSVGERIDPQTIAGFSSTLRESGGGALPSFHVSYVAEGEHFISQRMNWFHIPRGNERLGTPDLISFSMPMARPDEKGSLRFSTDGQMWTVPQEPRLIKALRHFGSSWVNLEGWMERNQFWKGSGWRVEAVDRRRRAVGATEIRLPGPDRLQAVYARLRVEHARFEANPAEHCKYYPPPEPEDGDIVGSGR